MDGGAWWAAVHGVAKSRTGLSDFTFTFHFHVLEKEMATHSSVLAWRIPGTGELGGLPSMGSHRVRHDWSDLSAVAAGILYRVLERSDAWINIIFVSNEWYPQAYESHSPNLHSSKRNITWIFLDLSSFLILLRCKKRGEYQNKVRIII